MPAMKLTVVSILAPGRFRGYVGLSSFYVGGYQMFRFPDAGHIRMRERTIHGFNRRW